MKNIFVLACLLIAIQSFAQTGNVGIGTTNPKAQLHTTGSVRFDTLRGNTGGYRPVYVNDSGNLFTSNGQSFLNNSSYAIPDGDSSGATSPVTVTGLLTPVPGSNIQVRINITHPYDGELIAYLISPSGQYLSLTFKAGYNTTNNGPNFSSTIFTDNAAQTPTYGGAPPYTGTFKPEGVLIAPYIYSNGTNYSANYSGTVSSFSGFGAAVVPNGTWKLRVIDAYYNGNVGTINNWSISFDALNTVSNNFLPKVNNVGVLINSQIYDNGNVGIGTTTPSSKLDINGTANATTSSGNAITGTSTSGDGVVGTSTTGRGVRGVASGSSGIGISGTAIDSNGVYGASSTASGIYGTTGSTVAGTAGIKGTAPGGGNASGVIGTTTGGYGVRGEAGNGGWGVTGAATTSFGVRGESNSGTAVYGITSTNSTSLAAIAGNNTNTGSSAIGVLGTVSNGSGVRGAATATGGTGVYGEGSGGATAGYFSGAVTVTGNTTIGAATPGSSSAVLDVRAVNKGVSFPNVTLASETDAVTVASPAAGLVVYNTTSSLPCGAGLYFNNGTATAPVWACLTKTVRNFQSVESSARSNVTAGNAPALQPGCSVSFVVPAGQVADVTMSAAVGASNVSTNAGAYSFLDATLSVNGAVLAKGGYLQTCIINPTAGVAGAGSLNIIGYKSGLAAGSYIIQLSTACSSGNTNLYIGGIGSQFVNAGEIHVQVTYR